MTDETRLEAYKDCMVEIKGRISEIDMFLSEWRHESIANEFSCEAVALQLRKVYELVAFAAMSADIEKYKAVKPSFREDWNFAEITKRIQRFNSNFLPKPVLRRPSSDPRVNWHLEDHPHALLNREELCFRHGQLNVLLHARNPFSEKLDVVSWLRKLDTWTREIASLLSQHRYVVGEDQSGFLVELNGPNEAVTAFAYASEGS